MINPSDTVRDLGVLFDQYGTMKPHVNEVCRKASAALWRIGKIRSLLDQKTTERLIHAFVTSRLDYCNSLLFGLNDCLLSRLQLIQNSAMRLVTLSRKFDHITPILADFHWLPVSERIKLIRLLDNCFNLCKCNCVCLVNCMDNVNGLWIKLLFIYCINFTVCILYIFS